MRGGGRKNKLRWSFLNISKETCVKLSTVSSIFLYCATMESRSDDIWDRILARLPRIPSIESLQSIFPDISSKDSTQFELALGNDDEINSYKDCN